MRPDWRPKIKPDLLCEAVEDEVVVLEPEMDQVHVLNLAAAAIYELCDGTRSVDQIIDLLRSSIGNQPDEIAHDVNRTLREFSEKGLLE